MTGSATIYSPDSMSYDVYCYRAESGTPDVEEAEAFIEEIEEQEEAGGSAVASSVTREAIVAALLGHNPRLERFEFDYRQIAAIRKISESEARARYQYAQLTPPEGDLAIQLTVHEDHVFISIPYWYKGGAADPVFSALTGYVRVIGETVGFFVYDPQTGKAFDPQNADFRDHSEYERVVRDVVPKFVAEADKPAKPWWRFW